MKREIEEWESEKRDGERNIVYKEYPGKIFLASHVFVRIERERDKRREGKREKADGQMKEVEIRWERENTEGMNKGRKNRREKG